MKEKSQQKGAYAERWRTPISGARWLDLEAIFQSVLHTHFFFFATDKKFFAPNEAKGFTRARRDIHVLTINREAPYRVTEEGYGYTRMTKYLPPIGKGRRRKAANTWKLWGTSFLKDLDEGRALSGYGKKRNKKIYEYLIVTGDEWIEFVSGDPKWDLLRNVTLKEAVRHYFEELD